MVSRTAGSMRFILLGFIFLCGTVSSKYHVKTRFDRSVEEGASETTDTSVYKQRRFIDYDTRYVAYKEPRLNACYLQKMQNNELKEIAQRRAKAIGESLTRLEAWRLAGGRVVDFCRGFNFFLLQDSEAIQRHKADPFLNELPEDENDIARRRVADVVLTPLINRAKRQILLEKRKKLNEMFAHNRQRRHASLQRGRFRGQTQSQYLNIAEGEQKEGRAEAEATPQSSHAIVSGSRGMGQAQSMSSGGNGCEDCPGYPGHFQPDIPGKLQVPIGGRGGVGGGEEQRPYVPAAVRTGTTGAGQITQPGMRGAPGPYPGGVSQPVSAVYPGGFYPTGVARGTEEGVGRPADMQTSGSYPGITPGSTGTTYIGGSRGPGVTQVTGIGVPSPGGVAPGITTGLDSRGPYPGSVVPDTTGGGTYLGGAGTVTYPGTGAGRITYPGTGTGTVTYPGTGTGTVTYPTTSAGTYPGSVISGGPVITGTYPGGIPPGTLQPGTGGPMYPGGVGPHPTSTGIGTGTVTAGGRRLYPPGTGPEMAGAGITYSGTIYPGGAVPGTIYPGGGVTYPGGASPGRGPTGGGISYPGIGSGAVYPSEAMPGTGATGLPGGVITTSSTAGSGTSISYPGVHPAVGTLQQPGTGGTIVKMPGGTPGSVYPGSGNGIGSGAGVTYPGMGPVLGYSSPGMPGEGKLPGQQPIPGGGLPGHFPGGIAIQPGMSQPYLPGQYPDNQYTGTGVGGLGGQERPIAPGGIQYPGGVTGGAIGPSVGGYPIQYPGGIAGGGTGSVEYYQRPGGASYIEGDDGSDSQASSSVKQVDAGTEANASSQGKFRQGTAQSQVSGTYSGIGSFSAQAGTSDANKSTQAQVSGGKQGAISNAQGTGGYGKSQAQVQLDSDSGATSTGAQSSGWNHETNSQVQASSKGGMADAQANGEGSTSSQAQIGFQPYLNNDDHTAEKHSRPFRGGGTASAQSGTHRGQSQSQIQGSFQYGITYTGAAQAASGSGAAASRRPFNFSDSDLFKTFKPYDPPVIQKDSDEATTVHPDIDYDRGRNKQGLETSSSSHQIVVTNSSYSEDRYNEQRAAAKDHTTDKTHSNDADYDTGNEDYNDEYEDEDYDSSVVQISSAGLKAPSSSTREQQATHVTSGTQYDVRVTQKSKVLQNGDVLQPGESISGYTVPAGFRGKVTSVSGDETVAKGDGNSQAQTVSLYLSGSNNTHKFPVSNTRSLHTYERFVNNRATARNQAGTSSNRDEYANTHRDRPASRGTVKPSYYTVTNSVAGKMDGNNAPRKYEHRYYTKSSTCGYFTFSCNIVYGSNGRTKICKPKMPTYSDGTPIKC